MNQIHGLEAAQNNLTGYLEAGKATQTIMDKLQKNEAELQILKTQLEAKSKEIPIIDEITYQRLVRQFMNYMCTEKSSEAYELKEAVIKDIKIDENKIEIQFNQGVTVDDDTINYFNNNKED